MASESFKVDNNSSTEDIELKVSSQAFNESTVEAEDNIDGPQENTEDGPEGSAEDILIESLFGERSQQQTSLQDYAATSGANEQDSQESLSSDGGSGKKIQQISPSGVIFGTESQKGGDSGIESHSGGATSGTESQPGGAIVGTESQSGGAIVGTESQSGDEIVGTESQSGDEIVGTESQSGDATSGTESQTGGGTIGIEYKPGCDSSTNSEYSYAASSLSRQTSQDSSSNDYGSIHSRETAVVGDSVSQASLESDAAGDVSRETAVVGDSIFQASLESDAAGDVSNSSNTQEELDNGIESREYLASPVHAGPFPYEVERDVETEEITNFYVDCFRHCDCVCDYLTPCSMWLQKYRIITYFFRASMAITALLAFYFGAKNVSNCPVDTTLPILLILFGIDLAVILFTIWKPELLSIITKAMAHVGFFLLFLSILCSTYTMSPSFDHADLTKYCKMEFYYFAYYVNFVIAAIIIFAFFLYIPTEITFNHFSENTQYLQL